MDIIKNIEGVRFNSPFFWNLSLNPEANIENCIPNCTAMVYGLMKQANLLPCVDKHIYNARDWHKHLINGWYAIPYEEYKKNIKVGDVIEWESGNHVAIVSDIKDGTPWISGSFYTGNNGKAYDNGGYSKREGFRTVKDVDDFFFNNYPYRYFHFVPLEEESKWCGGNPDYVLVCPETIKHTERNYDKDQVYVGITGLRIRKEPTCETDVIGVCDIGYYDVEEIVKGGGFGTGNKWYKVDGYYIAAIEGTTYYKKEEITPLTDLSALISKIQDEYKKVCEERDLYKKVCEERDLYKNKLIQIGAIANDK